MFTVTIPPAFRPLNDTGAGAVQYPVGTRDAAGICTTTTPSPGGTFETVYDPSDAVITAILDGSATSPESDGFTSTPTPPKPPAPESYRTKPDTEPVLLGLFRGVVGPEEQLAPTATHNMTASMMATRPWPRARPLASATRETAIAPSGNLRPPL